jgi:uncharacterized protein YneF (UPF0154 family)
MITMIILYLAGLVAAFAVGLMAGLWVSRRDVRKARAQAAAYRQLWIGGPDA